LDCHAVSLALKKRKVMEVEIAVVEIRRRCRCLEIYRIGTNAWELAKAKVRQLLMEEIMFTIESIERICLALCC